MPHLLRDYNPSCFEEYFSSRPLEVMGRCMDIAMRGAGWLREFVAKRDDKVETVRLAKGLRKVLVDLGPSFVKLGQVLSSRVDLLPTEYVNELKVLTDQVQPFPLEVARNILEKEWALVDAPFKIADLPQAPVAAASLGQVYRVETSPGEALAIKIQRPGARQQICMDLYVLRRLAPWLRQYLGLNTDLVALVDEYGSRFVAELDYTREADNAEQFQAAMRRFGFDSVLVAEPVRALTTGRVLATQWVEGERIDADRSPEGARLCGVAMTAYLMMLLETDRLHADPHPGNLLRTTDGRLCILDWGLVTFVKASQQQAIISYFVHILAEDYKAVPEDLANLGFIATKSIDAMKDDVVVRAISMVFKSLASGGTVRRRVKDVIPDVQDIRRRYGNIGQLPAYFTYILRAFTVLEGIGLDQDPGYAIVSDCYPYIVSRLLRQDGDQAQQVLEAMLYGAKPAPGQPHPPLNAKRVLKLVDAFNTYASQAAAPEAAGAAPARPEPVASDGAEGRRATTSRRARRRASGRQTSMLRQLVSSEAVQAVMINEAARTGDVIMREAVEMLTPLPWRGLAPVRTAEDEAVMESLETVSQGVSKRVAASVEHPERLADLVRLAIGASGAGSRLAQDLGGVRPKAEMAFARLTSGLLKRAAKRLRTEGGAPG